MAGSLYSQENKETGSIFQYGISYHKARILIHNEDLDVVDNSYPNGLQMDLAWQQRSESSWNMCHCFPKMGLSVIFWDYDKPDILGYGASGIFFIEPEYNSMRKIAFAVRAGFGLTYMSNPYHETSNPENRAYSTSLNFALILGGRLGVRLSERTRLDLSVMFNHNSNGGVKSPNRGLNYPSASLGFSRYIASPAFEQFGKSDWDRSERANRLDVAPFISWKQVAGDVHRYSGGLEIKKSRQFGRINAWTLGVEYLYDTFETYYMSEEGKSGSNNKFSSALGHEFLLGKLIFSQQFGVYVYKPNGLGADFYQRYGLTYSFTPKLALGVNLKSHGHVAQLVDYRVVYSL